MTEITGNITQFLDALGTDSRGEKAVKLVESVGGTFHIDPYNDCEYVILSNGVTLLADYRDDMKFDPLTAIFIYPTIRDAEDSQKPYPALDLLIEGLSMQESRDEIRAFLGDPEKAADGYDLYRINGKVLHLEFDKDDHVKLITLMLKAIGE